MSIIGAVVACLIATVIPAMHYVNSIAETKNAHSTEAHFLARSVEKIIQTRPEMWEYENIRLKMLISQSSVIGEDDEREIRSATGKLIAKNDFVAARPSISISKPFFDSGQLAGSIVVRTSIREHLIATAISAVLSSLLGYLIYYVFRTYPLRKLNGIMADLQRERDKSNKTLYAIGDGVITVDSRGQIQFINRAAIALVGRETFEAVGRQLEDVYVVRYEENRTENTGERVAILTGKGGNEYFIEEVRTNLTEVGVDESGVVIVFRDVSERNRSWEEKRALEQQFQHSQKLESLGVLAGGIAHDFNNILAVIICNCSLAIQRPKMAEELILEIEKAAERAADLCRQMLAYAGKAQFVQSHVNMSVLLDEMLKMLRATIHQNVFIKPDLAADIPYIKCDASQIRQIIMNLIINASEAIGEAQGEIHVSLAITEVQQEKDHLGRIIAPGLYACLEITDNGCGMDEETNKRIFEPFYTTKFTGRGLGMSAVLGIIRAHKGALQLSSQPGRGTTFKVYLPIETGDSAGEPLQQVSSVSWRGSGTILLVEDEPQLMLVAKTLLKALGFDVFEAENGRDALELYRKNADYISIVVTDVGMPVMDGYDLFRELKKIKPELPIIISSGYGDMTIESQIPEEETAGYLSKPYNLDQVRKLLRSVEEAQQKKA